MYTAKIYIGLTNLLYYLFPDKSAYLKIIFLISEANICFGYSKEPSQ